MSTFCFKPPHARCARKRIMAKYFWMKTTKPKKLPSYKLLLQIFRQIYSSCCLNCGFDLFSDLSFLVSPFLYRLNEIQSNKMHFRAVIQLLIQFRRNKIQLSIFSKYTNTSLSPHPCPNEREKRTRTRWSTKQTHQTYVHIEWSIGRKIQ